MKIFFMLLVIITIIILLSQQLRIGHCLSLNRSYTKCFLNTILKDPCGNTNTTNTTRITNFKRQKSAIKENLSTSKSYMLVENANTFIGNDVEKNALKTFENNMHELTEKMKQYFDNNIYIENNKLGDLIKDVELSKEEICMLYEDMYLGRFFENLVAKLYYNKRVHGFVHLYNGQEAISSGIIKNLRNSDFVVSTYRDHVHALSKNVPPKSVLNELYGNYYGSTNKGKGGSMHIFSKEHNFIGGFAFIGEQIPISIGLAYSILYKENFYDDTIKNSSERNTKYKESDTDIVVCFLGDGTANIGQFYESLNLASTYNLPILFVVENNNWAIGMENSRSTVNDMLSIYSKGKSFNIDTYKVDGNDVLSIYKLTKKKIKEMRKKQTGPVLIEAITYRSKGHSLADPDELRKSEEKSSWKKIDPIDKLMIYMKESNIVDADYFNKVKMKTQNLLKDIEKDAEENKTKKIDVLKILTNNVFAPSENIPFQENYNNYKRDDTLSEEELEKYYKEYIKEQKRKIEKKKKDPNEKFNEKCLPLVID